MSSSPPIKFTVPLGRSGLNLLSEHLFQVCNQAIGISGLDDHVGFNISMQLIGKAHLSSALIGCSYIFQTKRHSFVGVNPERGDERSLDLILLLVRNLVIS
jgi:hypothetical protein